MARPSKPVVAENEKALMGLLRGAQFMMGRMYSALQDGKPEILEKDSDTHYFHCVDYVRQAVMCAGDVALEPHSETDGPDNGPLDGGWNGIHVCKNYGEVISYLERV